MPPEEIHKKYFEKNTRGYKILSGFYFKYFDLFTCTIFPDFNDFLNQIFMAISKIDFNKDLNNVEAYLIASIKIQCRVQIDKSVRAKKVTAESRMTNKIEEDEDERITSKIVEFSPSPYDLLEKNEMLNTINSFKLGLREYERELLNFLIDELPRTEIAEKQNLKLNTLDTHIRRLRIKLSDFLKKQGYSSNILNKFS